MENSEFNVQVMDDRLYKKQIWLETALVKLMKKRDKLLNQIDTLKSKESPLRQTSPTPLQYKPGTSKVIETFFQQADNKAPVTKSTEEAKSKSKNKRGGARNKRKRHERDETETETEEGEVEELTEASSSSSEQPETSSPPTKFFAVWEEGSNGNSPVGPVRKSADLVQSESKSKKGGAKTKTKRKTSEEETVTEVEGSSELETSDSTCRSPEGSLTAEFYAFCDTFDKAGASVDAIRLNIKYAKMSFVEKIHEYVHHMRRKTAYDKMYNEFVADLCARRKLRKITLKKPKEKEPLPTNLVPLNV